MNQITRKSQKKFGSSALHLITDYRLLITAALLLSGCMGIYEGGFECPAGTGVGCKSISEVNQMVNQGELPKEALPKRDFSKIDVEPPTPRNHEIWYAPRSSVQYPVSSVQKDSSENSDKISFPKKGNRKKVSLSDV